LTEIVAEPLDSPQLDGVVVKDTDGLNGAIPTWVERIR
jgi:hypothetical protein